MELELIFVFTEQKLELLPINTPISPEDIKIIIDGIQEFFSEYTSITTGQHMILSYEKTELDYGIHRVEIISPDNMTAKSWNIDAIDVDSDGELIRHDYFETNYETPMRKYGVAWFGFDEASGNVLDKLSNKNVGTVTGATRVEGWNGKGTAMNLGTGANKSVNFNSVLLPYGAKTIRFKFKCTTINNQYYIFMSNANGWNSNGWSYQFSGGDGWNGTMHMGFKGSNGTYEYPTLSNKNVCDGKWHESIFSLDGGTKGSKWRTYLDGELVDERKLSQNEVLFTKNFGIYNIPYGTTGNQENLSIDDLQIYNKALSPSDFTQKRLIVKTTDNKNLVLSPTSNRVKEIPNTAEYMMLAQGGIVKEIDSAVDCQPIDFTKTTTEYEIV
ncbi:LamG-like jellyroll fold domain-containing protein, partial [Lysinibacillus sp. NPDC093692]|uniref:LamG-like jellyroll fold domain-containing protein n=1 Tax=Lysinibacillus sp. NPDC093692 TaxID=3390578 RepID=UPI003CFF6F78